MKAEAKEVVAQEKKRRAEVKARREANRKAAQIVQKARPCGRGNPMRFLPLTLLLSAGDKPEEAGCDVQEAGSEAGECMRGCSSIYGVCVPMQARWCPESCVWGRPAGLSMKSSSRTAALL
jgi:hypothetical protein